MTMSICAVSMRILGGGNIVEADFVGLNAAGSEGGEGIRGGRRWSTWGKYQVREWWVRGLYGSFLLV